MATAATATRPSGPVLSISNYGSASPNRVKLAAAGGARSPAKSVSVSAPPPSAATKSRHTCMCSPTNHPGSFRCSLHKEQKPAPGGHVHINSKPASPPSPPMSAVVSTGGGMGDGVGSRMLARRAIGRSPQSQLRRRVAAGGLFRPRPGPSRLAAVSAAGDRAGYNRQ